MKVLIIGAGYAGVTAALRLARFPSVEVTLVNPRDEFVERIRLHEAAAGRKRPAHRLSCLLGKSSVRLVLGTVELIDPHGRTAAVRHASSEQAHDGYGEARRTRFSWDRMILAMGSRTYFSVPGAKENSLTLDADGAAKIHQTLQENLGQQRSRVLVIGGGLTGVEIATELAESHPTAKVTLLSRTRPLREFSSRAQAYALKALRRLNVRVTSGVEIVELCSDRAVSTKAEYKFDLCVWSAGFETAPLPDGLLLSTDQQGRIFVNSDLSVQNHPQIFAVGDCARYAQVAGLPIPGGCKSAGPSAAQAADNILRAMYGRDMTAFRFRAPGFCVSLGRKQGIVQWTAADGTLNGPVTLGRPAAWLKELVCRLTIWSFHLERLGLMSYSLTQPSALPQAPKQLTNP